MWRSTTQTRSPVALLVLSAGLALPLTAQTETTPAPVLKPGVATAAGLGERVYRLHCATCHGVSGDGWGERHETTYARPRSFLSARFKFSTTENGVPSDADLLQTLRDGLPGSGMPNWGWLTDEELAAVARYVRHLGIAGLRQTLDEQVAAGELTAEEAEEALLRRAVPGPPVPVPPEPGLTAERMLRGARLYTDACAPCHGADGNPAAGTLKTDFEGNQLLPTSFAKGVFKGGGEAPLLYVRMLKGIPGTAMPAFEGAYTPDELWDIVHHLQSLASPGGGRGSSGGDDDPAASVAATRSPPAGGDGAADAAAPVPPKANRQRLAPPFRLFLALGAAALAALILSVWRHRRR